MRKTLLTIIFIFITLFTIACTNLNSYSLSFKEDEIFVSINEEIEISFTSNINNLNEIKYSFSNPDIVQYDNNKFIFTEIGEVTITAFWEKNNKVSDSVLVVIKDINREITYKDEALTLYKGEEFTLEFNFINLTSADLAYRLSNQSTITVTNDWVIQAKEIGEVTLTVFYINNDEIQVQIQINIEEKKSIDFTQNEITIDLDDGRASLPIKLTGISLDEIAFYMDKQGIIGLEDAKIIPLRTGKVVLSAVLKSDFSVFSKITIEVIQANPPLTIYDYEYWVENLNSQYDSKSIILTQPQIIDYNNTIFSNYNLTKVVDLLNQPATISKASLEAIINNYSNINSYSIYNNGQKISTAEKDAILTNRNLAGISNTVTSKYGIISNFAALRSYPTNFYSNSAIQDMFQETGLNVGEGAIVYHTSSDQKWYFIQAANYNGWIEAKNIALCSYNEMKQFLNADNFVLITADKLLINDVYVRMGQRIPYTAKSSADFTVSFPTRDTNGNLLLKDISLSTKLDITEGYLEYTLENVFNQGFKMLGIPYSWGDKYVDGRDCSSTQNAIYACFGFIMPRNTSNQNKIPTYSKSVSSLSLSKLKEYAPGTLLFSSGHVLMYIGEDANGNSYVLHNTSASISGCKVESLQSYGIHKIIATLKLYSN